MSDPLADILDEAAPPKSKGKGTPLFAAGDKVQLKCFHGRWDFDLNVVTVYWAGVAPNDYWMIQARMGENSNACIYAPQEHFTKQEGKSHGRRQDTRSDTASGDVVEVTARDPLLDLQDC